jgi:hypothetical protein
VKAQEAGADGDEQEPRMEIAMKRWGILRRVGQKLGPYLMLELLLPGGTLLAMLLFVWQRGGQNRADAAARRITLAATTALQQGVGVLRTLRVWPAHAYHPAGREARAVPLMTTATMREGRRNRSTGRTVDRTEVHGALKFLPRSLTIGVAQ